MNLMYRSDIKHSGEEGLVICMDIGTTHSTVSFVYLYKGEYPMIRLVTRWPGQESASGDAKIPTIIAYQNGIVQAIGAEAIEYRDDSDYEMAHWFKLHLHPDTMKESGLPPPYGSPPNSTSAFDIPALPTGVDLRKVYSDFIQYLYNHTRSFFIESMPNGDSIWMRLQSKFVVIFCHPNGWDVSQQAFLSQSIIQAGVIPEDNVDTRIEFVTEGDASVHYAVAYTPAMSWMRPNRKFVVVDAGGSTIDSNLYECKSVNPLKLMEVCRSECVQAGGIYVDRAVECILKEKLATSTTYGTEEMIGIMLQTKRLFGGDLSSNVIRFGRTQDNDRAHGIIKGRITLTSAEIESTFNGPVTRIVESSQKLLQGHDVQHLLLVGGFGESPYLRQKITNAFSPQRTQVIILEQSSKKAAVEGGAIWYMKHLVSSRAARFPIGMKLQISYDHKLAEHRERAAQKSVEADGSTRIPGFQVLIDRNTSLTQGWQYRLCVIRPWSHLPKSIGKYKKGIYVWEGEGMPHWPSDRQGREFPQMRMLCTIEANLKDMKSAVKMKKGPQGPYWELEFYVIIHFGATSMRAWMEWEEKKSVRKGPATILPGMMF
ncbi:hypothetical protein CPB86DRAFT_741882 [Serendipita vermifera]|nr:hypothetical protein CPB86DRAFT_741882 [Serendipita vermifera]